MKILFPTDFSDAANNAFDYALQIASLTGAKIVLFHAYYYALSGDMYVSGDMLQELQAEREEEVKKEFEAYQKLAEKRFPKAVGLEKVFTFGFAAEEIENTAQKVQADLVIMGTQGAGSEKLIGSVTTRIIQQVQCPVLAVPANTSYQPIKRIAYASSFQDEDNVVLDQLLPFAKQFDAEVDFVHVNTSEDAWEQLELGFMWQMYQAEREAQRLKFFLVQDESVAEGLEDFIEKHDINLLAMLSGKRNLIQRLFHPSITRKMALHSDVPLLVF